MNNRACGRCVILLPPGIYFERLQQEIIIPAICAARMEPVLIKHDSTTPVSMSDLAEQIRRTEVLLVDLSENTAEVWFAIGCALSLDRPCCVLSSEPMVPSTLSIMHEGVITYPADAFPSDYIELQQKITRMLGSSASHRDESSTSTSSNTAHIRPNAPTGEYPLDSSSGARLAASNGDLVSYEILALTIIYLKSTADGISPRTLGLEMQTRNSAHLTSHAMNALRRRRFIERRTVNIAEGPNMVASDNIFITVPGEAWLMQHGKRATPHHPDLYTHALASKHQ